MKDITVQRILWKVSGPRLGWASVRIRTLLPALALARAGCHVTVTDSRPSDAHLSACDIVVINKSFTEDDVATAEAARARGISVVFDLCDNIFAPNYGSGLGREAQVFAEIARLCQLITTTGSAMTAILEREVPSTLPIRVVPDGVETLEDIKRLISILRSGHAPDLPTLRLVLKDVACRERHIDKPARLRLWFDAIAKGDGWLSRNRKTVLWFGAPGRTGDKNGLASLRLAKPYLEAVNADVPIQLLTVSCSRKLFHAYTADFGIPSVYRDWSLLGIYDWLAAADLAIIPNAKDAASIVKSANRAVLSLANGNPVVADAVPAMAEFADCTVLDDWDAGLRRYLTDDAARAADLAAARVKIERDYSLDAIGNRWRTVLGDA